MEKIKTKILQIAFSDIINFIINFITIARTPAASLCESHAIEISFLCITFGAKYILLPKNRKKTFHSSMSARSQSVSSEGKFET